MTAVRTKGIDHYVLHVADAERSVAWYGEVLGLQPERLDEWREGKVLFVSLRVDPTTIIDLLQTPRTGENVNHVAFVVEGVDLDELAEVRHGRGRLGSRRPVGRAGDRPRPLHPRPGPQPRRAQDVLTVDFRDETVEALARRVRAKEVSARELTQAALDRIDAVNPKVERLRVGRRRTSPSRTPRQSTSRSRRGRSPDRWPASRSA